MRLEPPSTATTCGPTRGSLKNACVDDTSNCEQHGMGANGRHLAIVGGTDRDRLALRSVAAAALGMLDIGDIACAKAILRDFLSHCRSA